LPRAFKDLSLAAAGHAAGFMILERHHLMCWCGTSKTWALNPKRSIARDNQGQGELIAIIAMLQKRSIEEAWQLSMALL
jgi:hypothetical protein